MPSTVLGHPDVRDVVVFIYGLTDQDGFIRYVGKSSNPRGRLSMHLCRPTSAPMNAWLTGSLATGRRPGLVIFHAVPAGEDAEARFIELFVSSGRLLNVSLPKTCRRAYSIPKARDAAAILRNAAILESAFTELRALVILGAAQMAITAATDVSGATCGTLFIRADVLPEERIVPVRRAS